jgi:hypothetical protein
MGRTKNIVQTTTTSIVDIESGEVVKNHESKTSSKEVEPNFVKLYLDDIGRLHGLPPYVSKLLHALVKSMGYKNVVPMYKPIKQMICDDVGISMESLNKAVVTLTKEGILIPVGKGRGLYVMDPHLFGRGRWADIKSLRLSIDYSTEGKRRIIGTIEKQLEMEFGSNGKED